MNKNIILVALAILSSIELKACSFLRRYGANSYITNTPLFFKRQDPDAPQAKGVDRYEARETIIMEDNVDTTGKVKSKKTDTLKRRRRANS